MGLGVREREAGFGLWDSFYLPRSTQSLRCGLGSCASLRLRSGRALAAGDCTRRLFGETSPKVGAELPEAGGRAESGLTFDRLRAGVPFAEDDRVRVVGTAEAAHAQSRDGSRAWQSRFLAHIYLNLLKSTAIAVCPRLAHVATSDARCGNTLRSPFRISGAELALRKRPQTDVCLETHPESPPREGCSNQSGGFPKKNWGGCVKKS